MHAIPNHVNSNFQIVYFLAGSCHTPDGAYALLCNLKESREMALAASKVSKIKEEARTAKAKKLMSSNDEIEKLEGQAELEEVMSLSDLNKKNINAAKEELRFINLAIERINPLRQHKHLSDDEAHQASQMEEWKLELIHRAENYLLTSGTIPADHFVTMRQHPSFLIEILPAIQNIHKMIQENGADKTVLLINKKFDLPKLLELDNNK